PDNTHLELLAASKAEYEAVAKYSSRIDLASDVPIAQAVAGGEPIYIGSPAAYAAKYPASWRRMIGVTAPIHVSFAIIPLLVGDQRLGAICLTYDHERVFDEMGRNFKTIVARNCALPLERVQLLAGERAHAGERAQLEAAERAASLAEESARAREEILSV